MASSHDKRDSEAEETAMERNVKGMKRLKRFQAYYLGSCLPVNFDYALWQPVKIISAELDQGETTGKALFSVSIPANLYTNYTGNVAGGAVATLLDGLMICTMSLIVKKGFWEERGVSRNLLLHFFKPIIADRQLEVECVLQSSTARMISFEASLRDLDGVLLAKASQDIVSLTKSKL